jgi:hypothetical protein
MEAVMNRFLLTVAALVVALAASSAEAGPFRRGVVRTRATACESGSCSTVRTVARGGSAQAHAEAMASSGSLVHASSHPGYEGIGYGSTPEAAVANCCNNGGAVFDQGVAYGHGRYFACVRRR